MSQWYYSQDNQQQGPVSAEQLRQLAATGRLQPGDLVWKEGMGQWVAARSINGLFPNAPASSPVPIATTWYYSKAGQQQGPVSDEQLRQLAATGQLQPSDLVWKEGMGQWTEARRLKGLFPMQTAATPLLPPPVPAAAMSPPPSISVTSAAIPLSSNSVAPPVSAGSKWAWATDRNHPVSKIIGRIVSVLVVLGLCVRFMGLPNQSRGTRLSFNGGELFYKTPVTELEANRLGSYLTVNKFFDGRKKTTQITKMGNTYQFRMVVKNGIEQDEKFSKVFGTLCGQLSRAVFGGARVEIHLCDPYMMTLRVIRP